MIRNLSGIIFFCFFSFANYAQTAKPTTNIPDSRTVATNQPVSPKSLVDTIEHSVLSSGTWYKIKINNEGIYKLTYSDLISMGFSDPENIRIYGNGGDLLPFMNNEPRIHDLVENAIYMNKGSDGTFNSGDYILFYGHGPVSWEFNNSSGMYEHQKHLYSDAAYYYLTTGLGSGKKIESADAVSETPGINIDSYDNYTYHELNKYNLLKSGQQWFGESIGYSSYDTTFTFQNLLTSSPVMMQANVVSRSANTKTFTFRCDNSVVGTISISGVTLSSSTGIYAKQSSKVFTYSASGDELDLTVSYNKTDLSDEGYIDYLILNSRCQLSIYDDALFFRDQTSAGTGNVTTFQIENAGSNTEIWNLSDMYNIRKMDSELNAGTLSFKAHTDSLIEYVAVNVDGNFSKPIFQGDDEDIGIISNQDLHGAEPHQMLIVTHPLFLEIADSIAEFHRTQDNLSVLVATTEEIYNEFSSGAPDVSAIRDYSRLVYNRATGSEDSLRYLLLLGDGSYNNHSKDEGNSNFILTYQSEASLNASTSYVSDDFFGFMDEDEGGSDDMEDYTLDLGIGRLPAKTAEEALVLFEKIKFYATESEMLDWRNNIMFVGDDEDSNIHMTQANNLADYIRNQHPQFNVKKVLLDAYQQESTASGSRYPEVNTIIYEEIHKGLLIFNYTGHGGERGLAAEQILMKDDLETYTNYKTLPLFVTASCEFSRFDDMSDEDGILLESTSAGETALLNPDGGSIGLLSTTRIAYSDANYDLNSHFYQCVFNKDANGNYYKLGDVMRITKNALGSERNKLNFILLGDPALTLAIPKYEVVTDSINGIEITLPTDTLKAFSKIRISGHLENESGSLLNDFNGIIYPSVFDKATTVTTLANDDGDPMDFEIQENIIFKGKASVSAGTFTFEFTVPKDISYSFGNGKMVYYAQNSVIDAHGSFDNFIIGGTDANAEQDQTGPEIQLYLNDENFDNQGISNTNPIIYAIISDESGINTVGNGIGHDITGIIDEDTSDPIILNEFYEADLDDYTSGTLTYPMQNLKEGWHSLTIKAWDVFNNSSEETIEFRVLSSDMLVLDAAYNYPNPAFDYTYFRFEHNQANEELNVSIYVYDLSGRIMATLEQTIYSEGFTSDAIYWDIKDQNGNHLRQGVYLYRIIVRDEDNLCAEICEKLVIIRQ